MTSPLETIEILREEIRQLKAARLPPVALFEGIRFSGTELVIMAELMRGQLRSQSDLIDCTSLMRGRDYAVEPQVIDVHICRIRKRLRELDPPVAIKNVWGKGYWMDAESIARMKARIVKGTDE